MHLPVTSRSQYQNVITVEEITVESGPVEGIIMDHGNYNRQ